MTMEHSARSAFMGVHVRPVLKRALQEYALAQGISLSAWISDLLENTMAGTEYDPKRFEGKDPLTEPPLPLDEMEGK